LRELGQHPSDTVIVKKRYSAFFGTQLDAILRAVHAPTLVIAGVNTHACVRTTVIDAYQRDYDVIVVSDGIASYDAEHHEVTRHYLERAMAVFLPSAEVVKRLS
jgi:isochorismate hydrolase